MTVAQLIAVLDRYTAISDRNGSNEASNAARRFSKALGQEPQPGWPELLKKLKALPKTTTPLT